MFVYVVFGGVMVFVILIVFVLWVGMFDGVGFYKKGVFVDWFGMLIVMSLYVFCFSGYVVFLMMYIGMSNSKMFFMVSKVEVFLLLYFVCFFMDLEKFGFL